METKYKVIAIVISLIVVFFIGRYFGYNSGYEIGYNKGYAVALESITPIEKPKQDTVQVATAIKTETVTSVRPKTTEEIKQNAPAVQINTKPPTVVASVNGNKYEFKPQTEILQTGVQTTAAINVKIPERRWSIGLGVGKNKRPAYMLKAPIKGAVGAWIAGQDKHNVMGGISISF